MTAVRRLRAAHGLIRRNAFTQQWHGREQAFDEAVATEGPRYRTLFDAGDPQQAAVWSGEAAGQVIERMRADAALRIGTVNSAPDGKSASLPL